MVEEISIVCRHHIFFHTVLCCWIPRLNLEGVSLNTLCVMAIIVSRRDDLGEVNTVPDLDLIWHEIW